MTKVYFKRGLASDYGPNEPNLEDSIIFKSYVDPQFPGFSEVYLGSKLVGVGHTFGYGVKGLVPAPSDNDNGKILSTDGWTDPKDLAGLDKVLQNPISGSSQSRYPLILKGTADNTTETNSVNFSARYKYGNPILSATAGGDLFAKSLAVTELVKSPGFLVSNPNGSPISGLTAETYIKADGSGYGGVFTGAGEAAGSAGLVPAPAIGDAGKYLKGDGTWGTVTSGVQSDWEEDDNTDLSYVQNRPAVRAGTGTNAVIEGDIANNIASGQYSHAEGNSSIALSNSFAAHAEGNYTVAAGERSHAEGNGSPVSGYIEAPFKLTGQRNTRFYTADTLDGVYRGMILYYSGAYGVVNNFFDDDGDLEIDLRNNESLNPDAAITNATVYIVPGSGGTGSHSEGIDTIAAGDYSHAEGDRTLAVNSFEHAQGHYNKSNKVNNTFGNAGNTIDSIGIGMDDYDRKNAVEVMQNGDVYVYGVGSYNGTNPNTTGVKTLQDAINNASMDLVIPVTYSELVTLKTGGNLVPGAWYRITNYHTTVSPDIDYARSADHQFDVIVHADDESQLNENGYAAHHTDTISYQILPNPGNQGSLFTYPSWMSEQSVSDALGDFVQLANDRISRVSDAKFIIYYNGQWMGDFETLTPGTEYKYLSRDSVTKTLTFSASDTYFANENLGAWRIKYSIDNIGWSSHLSVSDANSVNFNKIGTVKINGDTYILLDGGVMAIFMIGCRYVVSEDCEIGKDLYSYDINTGEITSAYNSTISSITGSEGQGTIFMLIDEYNNQLPYDFKNIQFKRWKVTDNHQNRLGFNNRYFGILNSTPANITIPNENDFIWVYTFTESPDATSQQPDLSVNQYTAIVHDNVIGVYELSGTNDLGLNDIVFYGSCDYNVFGDNCHSSTLNECSHNTFADQFNSNFIGEGSIYNSIGHRCSQNTLGGNYDEDQYVYVSFRYNKIGHDFQRNSIDGSFEDNSVGGYYQSNVVGKYCSNNSFGENCSGNLFGDRFSNNTLGDHCRNNSFGGDFLLSEISGNMQWCIVTGGSQNSPIKNTNIISGFAGEDGDEITITFESGKEYRQIAGLVNGTDLRIWIAEDTVTGPSSAVNNRIAVFDGTTGKIIKDSGVTVQNLQVDYTIEKLNQADTGYASSYILKKGNTQVGATINIPKDMVVSAGEVKTCIQANNPVQGLAVGDKYIDLTIANSSNQHIYIPVKDLMDVYTEGNGIDISASNVVSIQLDSANANGLATTSAGLKLNQVVASTGGSGGSAGAMSAADKEKLDGLVSPTSCYWATEQVSSAAVYNADPEIQKVTINGNASASAASTDHCVITYDTTNKCLKFTF